MPLISKIREQIIASFHAELTEHVQVMNDGLLLLEQNKVSGKEREETLANVFRSAHSLKGAARAIGVSAIEQLAHELEDVLGGLQHNSIQQSSEMFTACYKAIDACQAVLAASEAGEISPPVQALQALADLDVFRRQIKEANITAQSAAAEAAGAINVDPNAPAPAASASQPVEKKKASLRSSKKQKMAASDSLDILFNQLDDEVKGQKEAEKQTSTGIQPDPGKQVQNKTALNLAASIVSAGDAEKLVKAPSIEKAPSGSPTTSAGGGSPQMPVASSTPGTTGTPAGSAAGLFNSGAGSPPAPVASQSLLSDETIRVSVNKLDALMAQLSELLVTKIRAEQRLAQVRQAQNYMALWQKEWLAERGSYSWLVRQDYSDRGESIFSRQRKEISRLLEYIDSSQNRLREMSVLINNLSREYHADTMQMSLVIDGLEEEIKRVRMLPLANITGSFARMVRDLGQASGKEATLEILGGDVELDKRVLEQIKDPIIHLIRNAIDHGIENPRARQAAGKPACGKVSITAQQQGKDVAISVADDGEGIDIEAIRQVAIRRGIPNANGMTNAELVEQIYTPGFSTSSIITDVSGRGVGLDVVRRNIETLRGRVNVTWETGKGCTFTMFIPLTLTSSRCLLVRISGQLFAIPVNAIERIEHIRVSEVESVGGRDTIRYDDRPLMLAHLGTILGIPSASDQPNQERVPVIILSAVERRMAFAVDEMADEQEVVIKGLGKQLSRVGGIAGASVLGSGEIILILNVADLIKMAQRGEQQSILERRTSSQTNGAINGHKKQRILVVDDSITTRTLEKNILEASGFAVQLAMDGQEAYNTLTTGDLPDIIISDVSMPRLDGFGLTTRIRGDSRTAKIPVILVTSLDSPEDKARGIEAGADAYLIKSSFDQNNLLETIQQLI